MTAPYFNMLGSRTPKELFRMYDEHALRKGCDGLPGGLQGLLGDKGLDLGKLLEEFLRRRMKPDDDKEKGEGQ